MVATPCYHSSPCSSTIRLLAAEHQAIPIAPTILSVLRVLRALRVRLPHQPSSYTVKASDPQAYVWSICEKLHISPCERLLSYQPGIRCQSLSQTRHSTLWAIQLTLRAPSRVSQRQPDAPSVEACHRQSSPSQPSHRLRAFFTLDLILYQASPYIRCMASDSTVKAAFQLEAFLQSGHSSAKLVPGKTIDVIHHLTSTNLRPTSLRAASLVPQGQGTRARSSSVDTPA